ncbi:MULTISPECIES: hypothetical protein [unclassified Vibrio]|uniref:hypothetical protein n=1 Tax=unclassified Vibrio TaxID=2614977 RepID=UPI0025538929|nr:MULTISPECIES: hypothetical protein [unclassified Vibrio]MDK9779353.1 hypothetical protein [Vibrio sp. D401a]MDK9809036.1 hypothetical protein [Vibrio sp. D406a]HCM1204037.1 hypothetical protein [Vibrio parahaemolyticus]
MDDPVLVMNRHQLTINGDVIAEWVAAYSNYDDMWNAHEQALDDYLTVPRGKVEVDHCNHRVISYVLTFEGDVLYPKADNDLVY